jgi:tetratricopeptide (TPR) repeat protein
VAETLSSLATVAMVKGEWAAAEGYARQALAVRRKLVGEEHPDVAASLNQIGDILSYVGDSAGAEPLFRQALAIYHQLLGDEHPLVAMAAGNLGRTLHKLGDLAGAEPLLREGLEIRRRLDPEDPQLAYNARNLGLLLCDRGDYAGGEPALREAVTAFDRCRYYSGDDCIARIGLGDVLAHLDRFAEAEAVLIDADARLATIPRDRNAVVRASSSIPLLRWRAMSLLADLCDRWDAAESDRGHDQQATEWRAKLAEWQASTQPAPRRP